MERTVNGMSMKLANLICHVTIAVSTLFIAIYLNKIQENIEFIRRNLNSISDKLGHQHYIIEIVMKLDRIANILEAMDREDGENNDE